MTRKLIAEIGSCNGDIGYAYDAVDTFAAAGARYIKGQLYQADTLTSRTALPYGHGIVEAKTQHDAFSTALTYDEWGDVKRRCDEQGIEFFGSVFDMQAVDAGLEQGWSMFKIASADITYRDLIHAVASAAATTGAGVILSTGAATETEIDRAVMWVTDHGVMPTLLACTLSYPAKLVDANVSRMQTLRRWTDSVGYSDHTRGIAAALYAFQLGGDVVEKHVTLTPGEGGDHDFAITASQVKDLLSGNVVASQTAGALAHGHSTIGFVDMERPARVRARRSWHATCFIAAGQTITAGMVAALRPADGGIGVDWSIVGEVSVDDVAAGAPVRAIMET